MGGCEKNRLLCGVFRGLWKEPVGYSECSKWRPFALTQARICNLRILFAVYSFKYKLFIKILSSSLNTMLIVDKHCSDVCCDELASCLIYAKPLRQPFCWHPPPISVLVWVRFFIEPDVSKTMYRSTCIANCHLFGFCSYLLISRTGGRGKEDGVVRCFVIYIASVKFVQRHT